MTNNDDPFGRRDRTIIRPNPGGRRPPPEGAPPAGGGGKPQAPVSYPTPSQPAFAPADSGPQWEAWLAQTAAPSANPYLQPASVAAPMIPLPASPHVAVDMVTIASDPIMRAATSLMLLLGRLRASLSRGPPGQLMDQVAQAIQKFEIDAKAGGAGSEQVERGKYALAATADDIVQNLPGADQGAWTQYGMLVRFFRERTGGVKFFQELEVAKQNPTLNLGVLELMHACLSLGFEGVYRAGGGPGGLQGVRKDLYETIRRNRPKTIEDLSPHWRGQIIALAGSRFQIPIWSVAAVALGLLFGLYLLLRFWLSGQAEALSAKLSHIHPDTAIALARPTPAPSPTTPPGPIQSDPEVTNALADDILNNRLKVEQTNSRIKITIASVTLFPSGGATANPSFAPIAKRIAQALDKGSGEIRIEGHTDSDPIKTLAFASNFELSLARANSVATMLKGDLAKPDRVKVSGKGADEPLAPNDTPTNKAMNRRVEITVTRDAN